MSQRGDAMASTSGPADLNSHQRNTLRKIFRHPAGHNIEWRAVVSLLEAIGSVEEHRDGKIAVTVGSHTRFFDIPSHKDINTDTVVDLRHMLSAAGYEPQAEED
jgi:hypothetical protein